jgi:inositol transport system substrate-binding protein
VPVTTPVIRHFGRPARVAVTLAATGLIAAVCAMPAGASPRAATLTAASASSSPKECTISQCNVYGNVPWAAYKGTKVGILNLAPVPGATRWSAPLRTCLQSHGADVDYVDIGGDITKTAPTIQGWLTSGIKAIFDIGIPLDGETSLLAQAKAKHIPVILWGAGDPAGTVALDANQTVDGVDIANYLVNTLGTSFSATVLSNSTNPALVARTAGVKAVLSQYPDVKVSYEQVSAFTVEAAQQSATAILQANPKLSAIVGAYGDYGVGAANAVTAAHDKTVVVSMNGDLEEYAAIRTGGPLKATMADGHEAGSQLACQTGAVMLRGGKPVGSHVFLSSVFVDASNLPPAGQYNTSPRLLDMLGS